jgi:hypothetical protein
MDNILFGGSSYSLVARFANDSTSAICVAKNPVLHSKTKHIEVRYHFLRDNVEKGKIALIHVPTHDQRADIFTKPLDQANFTR